MAFDPLRRMLDRANRYGSDSDATLFSELLLVGEFIVKATTAAFVASVDDDREHHRYALLHALVRADGIGEWAARLDEVLTGTTAAHLTTAMHEARNIHTERCSAGDWRYEAVTDLQKVIFGLNRLSFISPPKIAIRSWFTSFAELRNKTRGHGATTPAAASELVPHLKSSIELIANNSPIFNLSWAYLHRNLSGRYRLVSVGGDITPFGSLKAAATEVTRNLPDGLYLYAGQPRLVNLIETNLDTSDYFFANGNFNGATFEVHSLISDERKRGDAAPYLTPAGERPPSETEGAGTLEVVEQVLTNLPSPPLEYIHRPALEADIRAAISNDRHPIVTLVGRGGIGKTSLALSVLYDIVKTDRFQAVVWFSARDIDLTVSGAKLVRPNVLTEKDIAKEYKRLIGYTEKTPEIELMAGHFRSPPMSPMLFVFDNFETVKSPVDLFNWIDLNIRLPNKALITSRFRDFKADFPIEISGMEPAEARALIDRTVNRLAIDNIVSTSQRDELIDELDGHPYVIKIVLGEIANDRRYSKPAHVVARKEDILSALFERTFAALSPTAARIFMTLCLWRSLVPQLAVEAMLLRHREEKTNPQVAIEQLIRSSLVERASASDGLDFLEVPLTAALFGRGKSEVSPIKQIIEADLHFLRDVGSTATSGLQHGIAPKVAAFFRRTAQRIEAGETRLEDVREVLEFFSNGFPPAWLDLSRLEEEQGGPEALERAAECIRRFLATGPDASIAQPAWLNLKQLYEIKGDVIGAFQAFLRASEFIEPPLSEISHMANQINNSDEIRSYDRNERSTFFSPIITLMERHIEKATATDLSRLAWMHLHTGEIQRAKTLAEQGLRLSPENAYCRRLVVRLANEV